MSLNINLIVHGVPMGQKIWGTKGDDERYISSFYGPKWDVPEVMKVDIMTFGGVTNCYYTFIKGQNVYDSQGRAGSYFALTLKVNPFYADIQNIYAILKAAYDKYCLGLCIQERNGSVNYIHADFQNVDTNLKELEKRLLGYISDFSVNDDIISFDGFPVNSQTATHSFNLHECSKDIAIKTIKKYGKLMVSPWYLSESASQIVTRYKEECIATTQKAQQEIELQKKVSQQKIDEISLKSQNEIETIKRQSQEELCQLEDKTRLQLSQMKADHELQIAEIKKKYADVDLKISSLKGTIKEKEKEISDLCQQCEKKDRELVEQKKTIQKLSKQSPSLHSNIATPISNQPKNWICNNKTGIIISIVSIIIVILVIIMCWIILYSPLKKNSDSLKNKSESTIEETKHSNPQISIKELTDGNLVVVVGQLYHVVGTNEDAIKGSLKSDEFKVEDNTIIAKREFTGRKGTIYLMDDDNKIDSIELQIKDSI